MSNQGYFEPTDVRTGKAPEHQKNAIRIKGNDLSNAEIVPNIAKKPILKRKPVSYWNDETIISELKEIIDEINHFPSGNELRKMKRSDLDGAISRNGGLVKFREIMGYKGKYKPAGYWTDKIIVSKLEPIIEELGYIPTHIELIKMNKGDLASAIGQHGGIVKFQKLLGYEAKYKPVGHWTDETIISELKPIIEKLGHFPTQTELVKMKRSNLSSAISLNGGIVKFQRILGYESRQKSVGYWTDEVTIYELILIIEKLGHFPTQTELVKMKRSNLSSAISLNGGIVKFQRILGYEAKVKPAGYWSDETIISELEPIINELGHFPTQYELIKMEKTGLSVAIGRHGGCPKFQELLGCEAKRKHRGYWTDGTIIDELKPIINELGHFPTIIELIKIKKGDLIGAITQYGGIVKFQRILGYESRQKSVGYWTDETIVSELEPIIEELGHFPSVYELVKMKKGDLMSAITLHGGIVIFQELLGFDISLQAKITSKKCSYVGKRGKGSENIVKIIIVNWLKTNISTKVSYNVKLAPGDRLEFVCQTKNKIVGIDVTNTDTKSIVTKKWRHKDYYKNLDEFWIVVFSNIFTEKDYDKWNCESPENVKVMSIEMFANKINYYIDEKLQNKINKYNACNFWNKEKC